MRPRLGQNNVAIGLGTLNSVEDGRQNTATGSYSAKCQHEAEAETLQPDTLHFFSNTAGSNNTATGSGALIILIPPRMFSYNTADGGATLQTLTGGNFNTAVGYAAGSFSLHGLQQHLHRQHAGAR